MAEQGVAAKMMMKLAFLAVGAGLFSAAYLAGPAVAFEVTEFDGLVLEKDGTASVQAGAHPYEATNSFGVNMVTEGAAGAEVPEESVKDIEVGLPAGMVGDPTATPRCSNADLADLGIPRCSPNSQVGVAVLQLSLFGEVRKAHLPIFNMEPPPGAPAEFGFVVVGTPIYLTPRLLPDRGYALSVNLEEVSQALSLSESTIHFWGVPGDPAHTTERGFNEFGESCPEPSTDPLTCSNEFTAPIRPFLTNPTACSDTLITTLELDTWQHPGVFAERSFASHDGETPPGSVGVTGCEDARLRFEPTLTVRPTTTRADTATGLEVDLKLPQKDDIAAEADELYAGSGNDAAVAVPALHSAELRLPVGMAINPAAANGLATCTESEIELGGPKPSSCPPQSKLGSAEIVSPLFDHPLPGSVFLAEQGHNKFGSLLAVYVAIEDAPTGTVIKLPGRLETDPDTGRLTARFEENPQLPFSEFKLNFFGGAGAVLTTPEGCGTHEVTGQFSPWSASDPSSPRPDEIVESQDTFVVNQGAAGQPCGPAAFSPVLRGGSGRPAAGQFSPFVLRLTREDGEERFSTVAASLPQGLLARLKGVPYCPDAALSGIPGAEGSGAAEAAMPSCPAASQVGVMSSGLGSGLDPFFAAGKAYLAGPYKGAPLSLALVVPALAGPFDLGNVVVRAALQIDPENAEVTVSSDPIPQFLHGIPLDIRSLVVDVNRKGFILNPTSCEPTTIQGSIVSQRGLQASPSDRFQVGGCRALAFKPRISLKLAGRHRRTGHPAVKATVRYPGGSGYANVARASVLLGRSELFENAHLKKVCTRPEFSAGDCPKGSIYGHASVTTPLLDKPLKGFVYLRSNGGERELPDLVADLDGQIRIALVGHIDSAGRGLRTTFVGVPDAPISKFSFSLFGGRRGLLVNSTDLCARVHRATVQFTGQNGRVSRARPPLRVSCSGRKS